MFLLATRANDAIYMPALLHELNAELELGGVEAPAVWGVGFYNDDRALTIRRPTDAPLQGGLHPLAPDVQTRMLMACATRAKGGAPGPHRFRRWLFGHSGNLESLNVMRDVIAPKLPDFIRQQLSRGSAGEMAFAMVLAELRRSGVLDDPLAAEADVRASFARGVDAIRGLSREAPEGPVRASFAVANGRHLAVASAGARIAMRVRNGLESLPDGPVDPARTDFSQVVEALKSFRAVVVASEARGPGWEALEDGQVIGVDGQLNVHPART
ncbi:MAG: class II glutamine amidotransferase [Myxococcota bacterium]